MEALFHSKASARCVIASSHGGPGAAKAAVVKLILYPTHFLKLNLKVLPFPAGSVTSPCPTGAGIFIPRFL